MLLLFTVYFAAILIGRDIRNLCPGSACSQLEKEKAQENQNWCERFPGQESLECQFLPQ